MSDELPTDLLVRADDARGSPEEDELLANFGASASKAFLSHRAFFAVVQILFTCIWTFTAIIFAFRKAIRGIDGFHVGDPVLIAMITAASLYSFGGLKAVINLFVDKKP